MSIELRVATVGAALVGLAIAGACSASDGGQPEGHGSGASGGSGATGGTGFGGFGGTGGGVGGVGGLGTGGSGGSGPIDDACAAVSSKADNELKPVDIIMAIDNSGSMTFEAQEVQNNMNTFANAILGQGIDVHVVIISEEGPPNLFFGTNGVCIPAPLGSGACPNDSNPPVYLRVNDGVSSNNALFKIIEHYPTYKPILRKGAAKYFAVVTDDESSMTDAQFMQQVGTLDPGWFDYWRFFGVFCTGNCPVLGACAATGNVYLALCQQSGTVPGDMCQGQSNFAGVFSQLAQTVTSATQLACEWDIPAPPPGTQFEADKVNVRYTPGNGGPPVDIYHVETEADCGPQGGWYYDNPQAPTKILVCPATCAQITNDLSGQIDLLFGCFTISVPR